jgi:hypothetical protein
MESKSTNTPVKAMAAYVWMGDEDIIAPLFLTLFSR